jgi:hypothetical protein
MDLGWKQILFDNEYPYLQLFTSIYSISQSIRPFLLGSSGTLLSQALPSWTDSLVFRCHRFSSTLPCCRPTRHHWAQQYFNCHRHACCMGICVLPWCCLVGDACDISMIPRFWILGIAPHYVRTLPHMYRLSAITCLNMWKNEQFGIVVTLLTRIQKVLSLNIG